MRSGAEPHHAKFTVQNCSSTDADAGYFNATLMFLPAFLFAHARRFPRRFRTAHGYPTPNAVLRVSSHLALATLRVPSLVSLLIFITIYIVTEVVFSVLFIPILSGWQPAFPLSWRFLLLLLFVVPIFSFAQVLRLLLPLLDRWNGSVDLSQKGYVMLRQDSTVARPVVLFDATEEEDALLENAEQGSEHSSRPTSLSACLAGPHHKLWWIQILTYVLLFVVSTWVGLHYEQPGDVRYRDYIQSAAAQPRRQGYGRQGKLLELVNSSLAYHGPEKIFIAAMFHNNERVIPYWHNSLVKVIHYLGPDNVFVSIVESYSTDNSPQLLEALDADLALIGVPRRILIADDSISKPDDMSGNNRVEFLAATRNHALEPLMEGGYEKVVFLNDIYIEPESLVELLETNGGDYDMACGLDFANFGYAHPAASHIHDSNNSEVRMTCGFFEIDRLSLPVQCELQLSYS